MLEYLDQIVDASPSSGGISTIGEFLFVAFNVFFGLGIGISVIGIILAGIKYIMAGGDVKATIQAKQSFSHSIIGFLLVIGGYTIYKIIVNLLGTGAQI